MQTDWIVAVSIFVVGGIVGYNIIKELGKILRGIQSDISEIKIDVSEIKNDITNISMKCEK